MGVYFNNSEYLRQVVKMCFKYWIQVTKDPTIEVLSIPPLVKSVILQTSESFKV